MAENHILDRSTAKSSKNGILREEYDEPGHETKLDMQLGLTTMRDLAGGHLIDTDWLLFFFFLGCGSDDYGSQWYQNWRY
jgi:hypothetical protein